VDKTSTWFSEEDESRGATGGMEDDSLVALVVDVGIGSRTGMFVDDDEISTVCVFVIGSTSSAFIVSKVIVQVDLACRYLLTPASSIIVNPDQYHPRTPDQPSSQTHRKPNS
jgi:hypothetical protein